MKRLKVFILVFLCVVIVFSFYGYDTVSAATYTFNLSFNTVYNYKSGPTNSAIYQLKSDPLTGTQYTLNGSGGVVSSGGVLRFSLYDVTSSVDLGTFTENIVSYNQPPIFYYSDGGSWVYNFGLAFANQLISGHMYNLTVFPSSYTCTYSNPTTVYNVNILSSTIYFTFNGLNGWQTTLVPSVSASLSNYNRTTNEGTFQFTMNNFTYDSFSTVRTAIEDANNYVLYYSFDPSTKVLTVDFRNTIPLDTQLYLLWTVKGYNLGNNYISISGNTPFTVSSGPITGYNFKVIWNPRVGSNSGNLSVLYNLNGSMWYTLVPGVDYTAVLSIDTVVDGQDTDYSLSYAGDLNTCYISSTVVGGSDKYKVAISLAKPKLVNLNFYFYMDKQQQTIYDDNGSPTENTEGTTENWLEKIANYLHDIIDLVRDLLLLIVAVVRTVGAALLLVSSAFAAFVSFFVQLVGTFIVQITSFSYSYISLGSLGLSFPSLSVFPSISVAGMDTLLQWICEHISRAANLQLIWGTVAVFGFIKRYVVSTPIVGEKSEDTTIGSGDLDG